MAPYLHGLGADNSCVKKKKKKLLTLLVSFSVSLHFSSSASSFHCKWLWSLSDLIQLISLKFNYKQKSPSYPSRLNRGSTLPKKLPLISQESLNYTFIPLSLLVFYHKKAIPLFLKSFCRNTLIYNTGSHLFWDWFDTSDRPSLPGCLVFQLLVLRDLNRHLVICKNSTRLICWFWWVHFRIHHKTVVK